MYREMKRKPLIIQMILVAFVVAMLFEPTGCSVLAAPGDPEEGVTVSDGNALSNALGSGGNVKLVSDITLTNPITINQGATLDLNGYTIDVTRVDGTAVFTVQNGAELEIRDDSNREIVTVSCNIIKADAVMEIENEEVIIGAEDKETVSTSTSAGKITGSKIQLFDVAEGTLSLKGGVLTENNRENENDSIIKVAAGSTFNMTGGIIQDNLETNGARGVVMTEGTVNLSGGAISQNKRSAVWGKNGTITVSNDMIISDNNAGSWNGGAIHAENCTVIIEGGALCGNTAANATQQYRGGAIYGKNATVTISGGYLCSNYVGEYIPTKGGGLCMEGGTAVIEGDAVIAGNLVSEQGGGVYIFDGATLTMKGGVVAGNTTIENEGGGICIAGDLDDDTSATITGGKILYNVTKTTNGDWGGGGIFCSKYATINIKNVLITENMAGGFGGGVAVCPTGVTYVFADEGGAVFDNKAEGENLSSSNSTKPDDHIHINNPLFTNTGYADYYSALSSVVYDAMLGGGSAKWYGTADGKVVESGREVPILTATTLMGLTAYPSSADKEAAKNSAKLIISGNYSKTHGGGILCNGVMYIGADDSDAKNATLNVSAVKALRNPDGTEITNLPEFNFYLRDAAGNVVATGTNDEKGNITFNNPITIDATHAIEENCQCIRETCTNIGPWRVVYTIAEGDVSDPVVKDATVHNIAITLFSYNVEETDAGGAVINTTRYRIAQQEVTNGTALLATDSTLTGTAAQAALAVGSSAKPAFVNTVLPVEITVNKIWNDENNKNGVRPKNITVNLLADGTEVKEAVVTADANGNWKYTFTNLARYKEYGIDIIYTITEDEPANYTAKVDGYNITNTYKPTPIVQDDDPDEDFDEDSEDPSDPAGTASTSETAMSGNIRSNPNTGDNNLVGVFAAVFGIGLLIFGVSAFVGTKRRK